ncbi:TPA: hypothetical protein HA238_04135 [Candidatus Micrarchaeota archaeon]|nr:hypothetical protein [Candidatus Micrarchaeota archaeon]
MVSKIGKGKLKTVKNVSSKNIKPQKTSRSPTQKTEIQKSGIQKMAEETVKFSAPFEQAPQVLTPILDKALEQQRVEEEKARKIASLDDALLDLSGMQESMAIISLQNTEPETRAELKQRISEIKLFQEEERAIPLQKLFMVERAFEVVEGKAKLELPVSESVSDPEQKSSLFDGMRKAISGLFSSFLPPKSKTRPDEN